MLSVQTSENLLKYLCCLIAIPTSLYIGFNCIYFICKFWCVFHVFVFMEIDNEYQLPFKIIVLSILFLIDNILVHNAVEVLLKLIKVLNDCNYIRI